ncbi:helix-turn-helix domain-containing protein [Lacticaseibacillus parakribbianus]|uniref:helix-turn-helix domain-containing protein n=1 Tax=Lacticaseibacillus parakribbianus TaxID=2970927 RepID=UPI0021CAECA8|nr:helix-turn-helix transcriptional regulator [Lacticaseibacillus parakribbianus]
MNGQELGAIFRRFRINHGVTTKQAAGANGSAATISRFERSESDISTETAATLMYNIGMGSRELDDLIITPGYHFPDPRDYVVKDDSEGLLREIESYTKAHPGFNGSRAMRLILSLISTTNEAFLTKPIEQAAADVLAYPAQADMLELTVLLYVLPRASVELIALIWRRLMALPLAQIVWVQPFICYTALFGVLRGDVPLRDEIKAKLSAHISDSKTEASYRAEYPISEITLALANGQDVEPYLAALEVLGAELLAKWLRKTITRQEAGVIHNAQLVDNAKLALQIRPNESLLSGSTLSKIRKQHGQTIDSLNISWSKAAQSRFENGKTQPGFLKTLQLFEALYIPLTLLNRGGDLVSSYRRAYNQVTGLAREAKAKHHTRKMLLKVVDDFIKANQGTPAGLLHLQERSLISSLVGMATELFPYDDPLNRGLTAEESADVVAYYASQTDICIGDLGLSLHALEILDQEYLPPMTEAIFTHLRPESKAWELCVEEADTFMCGPVYFQNRSLITRVAKYFKNTSSFAEYNWNVQAAVTQTELMAKAFRQNTPETRTAVAAFNKARALIMPQPANAFEPANWMLFALDKDYGHFK